MTKSLREKFGNDISKCIYAWWADQSDDARKSMAAFDKLPAAIRKAVNEYPLNVLPETVVQAVRIWGEDAVLEFLTTPESLSDPPTPAAIRGSEVLRELRKKKL